MPICKACSIHKGFVRGPQKRGCDVPMAPRIIHEGDPSIKREPESHKQCPEVARQGKACETSADGFAIGNLKYDCRNAREKS